MGKISVPRRLMGRYEVGRLLGRGTFAKVYQAHNVDTKEDVAIKIMDKDHLSKLGAVQQQIMREIDIMRRVRHPHIVRIHEVMATRKNIYVVMEFVVGGSLHAHLVHHAGMHEASARRMFQQLVSALDYCHSLGVYHRDIKPDNILVDDATGNVKVADFGLSALAGTAQRDALLHTVCGTPMFIAPEVFLRCGYDGAKADIWACGVVLFALVAGYLPFNRKDTSLYHRIRRCEYRCPHWFSKGLVNLVNRILCPNPARRITIPQMKEHSWFKKGFKEIPRSLSEPELLDPDSDSEESTASSESLGDPTSPMACHMHASVSAPSLTTLESTGSATVQAKTAHMRRPKSLNAFDIITSSPSLDLSGLFEDPSEEMQFVSAAPVSKIISKLEEIAEHVSFTARTKEYQVNIEDTSNGNQDVLLISAKILELTPELVMVKVRKKAGNTTQYRQFCNNELKPGLSDLCDGPSEDKAGCMVSIFG